MNLYCPECKEIRCASIGKGASIKINGKTNDYEMMKKAMRCAKCESLLVTEEEFKNKC